MPFAVADSLAAHGIRPVLFAIRGACDAARVERFRHHWIAVGQLGRATKLFREEGCRELMFIGSLVRPALSEIRFDLGTLRAIPQIWASFRGGDDHLLSGIGRIFEAQGFRMVGIRDVAPDLLMPEGNVTGAQPDERSLADIAKGREVLRALSPFDIGQAVVVIDGHVVGVEDIQHPAIRPEEVGEEPDRFFVHRATQFSKCGEMPIALFIQRIKVVNVQPLAGKLSGETPCARIGDHPACLLTQNLWLMELPGRCHGGQL